MGREMEGRFKKERIYVYLWLIHVRFDRKQQNSVKQLSFSEKIKKKKKKTQRDITLPTMIHIAKAMFFSRELDHKED